MRLLLAIAALATSLHAQQPAVVSATPDHGDIDIDPAATEIRIVFDQDMSPAGRSICGGGPNYPTFSSTPRWENPRTLIIPVKLEADHAYDLSINCPAAQNFRGTNGQPAKVCPISFRTGKAGSTPRAPLSTFDNRRALTALRRAIDNNYSYRDRLVKDWNAAFAPREEQLISAASPAAFARHAAAVLSAADDLHLWLSVNHARFGTATSSAPWNVNPGALSKFIPDLTNHNRHVASARIGDAGYIFINSLPAESALLKPAHDALDSMMSLPAIIIDLRANGGGDEPAARAFAARLAKRDAVYSKSVICDPSQPTGFTEPIDRPIRKAPVTYAGKVVVLAGPGSVSSAESFLLMLRHAADATIIGAPSRGSSGNPKPHDLGNGVTVFLPSWQDLEPDGTLLEGRGVQPNISVTFTGKTKDEVLDAALSRLRTPE
jgi:hypothetical protein